MTQVAGAAAASPGAEVLELELPPMPRSLSEIMQLRQQETPDMERLVEATRNDPAVAAGVLKRVNGAYYGLRREVYQVERAILLLGFNEVCRLAFTAAVKRTFLFKDAPMAQEVYTHIMRVSIASAAFARHLTGSLNLMFHEAAFTAGLLHQLGRMALLYRSPKGYAMLWRPKDARPDAPLAAPSVTAEQFVFNTNSARLGAAMAQHWSLPDNLSAAISFHHDHTLVTNPVLRMLTLIVSASSHAAAGLMAVPAGQPVVLAPSDALAELAQRRNADVNDLVAFLTARSEEVLQFTETMCQD